METATTTTTIDVPIALGTEYPDAAWTDVVSAIEAAEAELVRAREVKQKVDLAYKMALARRIAVQVPRDQMIATDPRTDTQVSRLAKVNRQRTAQIREAMKVRGLN